MMDRSSIEYTLLAMQSALLREVTPELRAVFIDIDENEQLLFVNFYYDGKISDKMIDLWDCVICEGSADLELGFLLESKIERLDYPQKIPHQGFCAYLRNEDGAAVYKENFCPKIPIKEKSLAYALLAVQHPLLAVVTPNLRAVIVDYQQDLSLLYIRFYYHGQATEELLNLWENAIKEAHQDFGSSCQLDGKIERVDCHNTIPFRGRYAYLRKE